MWVAAVAFLLLMLVGCSRQPVSPPNEIASVERLMTPEELQARHFLPLANRGIRLLIQNDNSYVSARSPSTAIRGNAQWLEARRLSPYHRNPALGPIGHRVHRTAEQNLEAESRDGLS